MTTAADDMNIAEDEGVDSCLEADTATEFGLANESDEIAAEIAIDQVEFSEMFGNGSPLMDSNSPDQELLPENLLPSELESQITQGTAAFWPLHQDIEANHSVRNENGNNIKTQSLIDHRDIPALRRARAKLTVRLKDTKLKLILRARMTGMVALINLFLDPELTMNWTKSSLMAARVTNQGKHRARQLRRWVLAFVRFGVLPLHRTRLRDSWTDNEDITQQVQLHLLKLVKTRTISANDVVNFLATPEMKAQLNGKSISHRSAVRFLVESNWRYGALKNGMYKDGHEDAMVVEYRKGFCERWAEYVARMVTYDSNGNKDGDPTGIDLASGRKRLILLTHDESTFFEHDHREKFWQHSDCAKPQPKGNGQSLMVSDFLTVEWGRLIHEDMCVLYLYFSKVVLTSIPLVLGRHESFSNLGRTVMVHSRMTTYTTKLTRHLTFLKQKCTGLLKLLSSLTTHQLTASALMTGFLPCECQKVHVNHGHASKVVKKCGTDSLGWRMVRRQRNHFIIPPITPPCPVGSRVWNRSCGNVISGVMGSWRTAGQMVLAARIHQYLIVAAARSCTARKTSRHKSPVWRNWLSPAVIFVTSTRNFTVS